MHFREECEHGKVGAQCRCPGKDKVTLVSCASVNCTKAEPLTDEEITEAAYHEIFNGARSMLEDWIDEEGVYSREEYRKIFNRGFKLLRQLEEKYL